MSNHRWATRLFCLLSLIFVGLVACAGDGNDSPDPSQVSLSGPSDGGSAVAQSGVGGADVASGACEEGDKRACHVTLGKQGNVLSCFVGVQFCVDAAWSQCGDGEEIEKVPSDDGAPLSLTAEKVCDDNPCDPRCSKWKETGEWVADGSECKWPWKWSADPKGSIDKANQGGAAKEPCTSGKECHQNQKCQDPSQGSCSHDICTKGVGLKKGCEKNCVDLICDEKPQCCEKTYTGTCEVEPCLTYKKGLTKDCDPDVKKTCDWDKTCCPYKQIETCQKWGIIGYKEVCEWIQIYKCGWRNHYICGWRWREFYICGWRWREFYICGWRWREFYICGWRWREFYVCGWRWREIYKCGWRWRTIYVCGWRWTYVCGWSYCCSFFWCNWCYNCWWDYRYECWWETVYVYECWWETIYVYECWWELRYVYECWWELRYVYECWWELRYVYECWWETRYVYECWWEERYECWWELIQKCWLEPVYGWIYYDCEKSYDGEWTQKCIDQFKVYAPGKCPLSWTGDWDATCIKAVHDTCHDYCDGVKKGAGDCVEWEAPDTDAKCADFELGVGLTCSDGGTPIIPICNTGSKEAPSGIPLAIMPKSSSYFGTNPGKLPGAKYCFTDAAIPAGECRNVKSCNVVDGDEVMVNPSTNASYNKDECYKGDNWGFYYAKTCGYPPNCPGGYLDTTKTESYETTCDAGQTPQWSFLSWDATTPADTEISFRVRTASTKSGLSSANWVSVSTKSTKASPDCSASGPAPCPIDLYDLLGKKDAQLKFLELEVFFDINGDKKKSPTLETWQISYTCIESL
ncbi:MAG: hypothetical protein FJ096_02905 [Deltaproteobacteria bacterium]|nr:hypothetical protein [Deltaproteobacteria bacterium]